MVLQQSKDWSCGDWILIRFKSTGRAEGFPTLRRPQTQQGSPDQRGYGELSSGHKKNTTQAQSKSFG